MRIAFIVAPDSFIKTLYPDLDYYFTKQRVRSHSSEQLDGSRNGVFRNKVNGLRGSREVIIFWHTSLERKLLDGFWKGAVVEFSSMPPDVFLKQILGSILMSLQQLESSDFPLLRCVLSAKVRKAWTGDDSAGCIVARFDPEEQLVPFVMFAGGRGATAGKGLVEQLCIGDLVGFHPAPVGERTAA